MILDLGANLYALALFEIRLLNKRGPEPLENIATVGSEGVERGLVVAGNILNPDDPNHADDVPANLANKLRLALGLHDSHHMASSMIGAPAGAGAMMALGVQTTSVALMIGRVGALDALEHKSLVPVEAARENIVANTKSLTGLDCAEVLSLAHILGRGEDGKVARLAASEIGLLGGVHAPILASAFAKVKAIRARIAGGPCKSICHMLNCRL